MPDLSGKVALVTGASRGLGYAAAKALAAEGAHVIALARTGGHKGQAARLLEISSKALAYKMRDYGVGE